MNKNLTQRESKKTSEKNKELIRHIFEEISKGNHQPFLDATSEDFSLTFVGSTPLSKTYNGLKTVSEQFIGKVMSGIKSQPKLIIDKMIAEGEYVVVMAHGEGGVTKNGKDYNNTYCQVIRIKDNKLIEEIEYCDTALFNEAVMDSMPK